MSDLEQKSNTTISSDLEHFQPVLPEGDDLVKFFQEAKTEKEEAVKAAVNEPKTEVIPVETEAAAKLETTEAVVATEPESKLTDIEKQAMEMGWRPADKFDTSSEGKRFISAEEFVERGQLFKKIDHQKAELQQLKNVVKDMTEHYKKTEELAYNRAMTDLINARNQAVAEGDVENFAKLDKQMLDVQRQAIQAQQIPTVQVEQQAPPVSEMANQFFSRNQHWFNNDTLENKQMVNFALAADEFMAIRRPELPEKERLALVEADIRRAFPHRFENANRAAPAVVATTRPETGTKKDSSLVDRLSHRQRALAKAMVEGNLYTSEEEYAKDLETRGALR